MVLLTTEEMRFMTKTRGWTSWLKDKYPDMELEDEKEFYDEVLSRVINNPRFYLDNLEDLWVFRCSFLNYHERRKVGL